MDQLSFIIIGLALIHGTHSIPKSNFFPFSSGNMLPVADDSFVGPILLSRPFKFFNAVHDSLFVNNNGAVSFIRGVPEYTPICGALDATSKLIAPFWGDVDNRRGGLVTQYETTEQSVLDQANAQLLRSFPNYPVLHMDWAFVSTWDSVPFFSTFSGNCPGETNTNTFQLTLTSDGTRSFAIFYYDQLTWTTGTASQGNCSGLGGQPAKAGFDVGDGQTFIELPGSCTDNVLDIAINSNVGETGVWIFRIDGDLESPPEPETPILDDGPLDHAEATPSEPQCPMDTRSPCANKIADLIDHIIQFYNEFPFTCLGATCGPSQNPFDSFPPASVPQNPFYGSVSNGKK